jgi:hypothetical protein
VSKDVQASPDGMEQSPQPAAVFGVAVVALERLLSVAPAAERPSARTSLSGFGVCRRSSLAGTKGGLLVRWYYLFSFSTNLRSILTFRLVLR